MGGGGGGGMRLRISVGPNTKVICPYNAARALHSRWANMIFSFRGALLAKCVCLGWIYSNRRVGRAPHIVR